MKKGLIILLLASLASLPYVFYITPSYQEFKKQCANPNRLQINKPLDFTYASSKQSCQNAFHLMTKINAIGFECLGFSKNENTSIPDHPAFHRYLPSEQWKSRTCQSECFNKNGLEWREKCLTNCFSKTEVDKLSNNLEFKLTHTEIIDNKLVKYEATALNEERLPTIKSINYHYYLYGNKLAKLIGGSSGEAPALSCDNEYNIFDLESLKRIQETMLKQASPAGLNK